MNQLVKIDQLSTIVGLSVHALRYHIRKGRISPLRVGRRMLFDPEDVIKGLKAMAKPENPRSMSGKGVSANDSIFENQLVERALGISEKERP